MGCVTEERETAQRTPEKRVGGNGNRVSPTPTLARNSLYAPPPLEGGRLLIIGSPQEGELTLDAKILREEKQIHVLKV